MAIEIFTASGTYTWPTATPVPTQAIVECWGGGGGGTISASGEGGGGGGAYARKLVTKTDATADIVVGAGGAAGSNGVDSTFAQGGVVSVRADGGRSLSGRTGGAGGFASGSTGDVVLSGGAGGTSSGVSAGGGGGGSSAGLRSDGTAGAVNSGATGGLGGVAPHGGDNGGAGGDNAAAGSDGSLYGGGGGGGGAGANGGVGKAGRVIVRAITEYPRERFVAAQCCPVQCAVPKILMVDDILNPKRTRYPLIATVTFEGWGEGDTAPLGCCDEFNRSYVLNLSYGGIGGSTPGHLWNGLTGGIPQAPRYAVGTVTPDALTGGDTSGYGVCATDPFGTSVAVRLNATEGLVRHNWAASGAVVDWWEFAIPAQTYRRWVSDCYPTLGAGSPKVFVCPDQIVINGPAGSGPESWCDSSGVTVTIDFSSFVEYPLSGDNIVTHAP